MSAILEIRPDLKAALDHLAAETHRSEADLANEAVASYLEREHHIAARSPEGLRAAMHDKLAADAEIEFLLQENSNLPDIIARIKATRYKSSLNNVELREAIEEGRD